MVEKPEGVVMNWKKFLRLKWKLISLFLLLVVILIVNENRCTLIENNILEIQEGIYKENYKSCSNDNDCSLKYASGDCGFCANNQVDNLIENLNTEHSNLKFCIKTTLSYFGRQLIKTSCEIKKCICINQRCEAQVMG